MAITLTSTNRDRIAQLAFGAVYASLRTDEKTFLDNAGAVPLATPLGIAGERLKLVNQITQWMDEAGAAITVGPDEFDHVFVRECVAHCKVAFRGREEIREAFSLLDEAWNTAIDAYTLADGSVATLNETSITVKMIRFHVIRHCMKRGTGKRRLFIPVKDIDFAAQWALNLLWNRVTWEFRTRQVQITLPSATPTVPTFDLPSGEAFDALTTRWLSYDDPNGSLSVAKAVQLTQTEFATQKAYWGTSTGIPAYFYVENRGAAVRYWHWLPLPDTDYTLRGACTVMAPAFTTATDTAPATALPTKFRPLLPDLTMAYVLRKFGADPDQSVWRTAMDQLDNIAPVLDDPGAPASEHMEPNDVYMDANWCGRLGGRGI